jgi:hypothetical protein
MCESVVKRSHIESTPLSSVSVNSETLRITTKPKCHNIVDLASVLIDKILSYVPIEFNDVAVESFIGYADTCQAFRRSYRVRNLPVHVIISLENISDFQESQQWLQLQRYRNIISIAYVELTSSSNSNQSRNCNHHCYHLMNLMSIAGINHMKSTVKELIFEWTHPPSEHEHLLGMTDILKFYTSVTKLVMLPYGQSCYVSHTIIDLLDDNGKLTSSLCTFNGFQVGEFCKDHTILVPMPRCGAIKCLEYGRLICHSCDNLISTVKCSPNYSCDRFVHSSCSVNLGCLRCQQRYNNSTYARRRVGCGVCIVLEQCIECDLEFCKEHKNSCGRCKSTCCNSHVTKLPRIHPFFHKYQGGLCFKCSKRGI